MFLEGLGASYKLAFPSAKPECCSCEPGPSCPLRGWGSALLPAQRGASQAQNGPGSSLAPGALQQTLACVSR